MLSRACEGSDCPSLASDFQQVSSNDDQAFVCLAGGLSLLFLSLFYFIIDVKGHKKWAFFFKVIGMNSILIYLSGRFINWDYTTNAFFGWLGQLTPLLYEGVVMAICYVFVKWVFLYFLYRQKIFLRV